MNLKAVNKKKSLMLKWINSAQKIDVVYHIDTDGLCSAAQIIKFLKSKGKDYEAVPGSPQKMRYTNFYNKLMSELVIFVDLPADQFYEEIYKLSNKACVVIIDHHALTKDLNNECIIHFNPELDGVNKYCPSSKQVYDLLKEYDWMAAIGLLGDLGGKYWKSFINEVEKKHGLKVSTGDNLLDSELVKYDRLINSGRMIKGEEGGDEALRILVDSEDFIEFKANSDALLSWEEEIRNYLEELKVMFERDKQVNDKLELVTFTLHNPKYNIGSVLSTILSMELYNKTVLIFIVKGSIVNVNLRRQDGKYDVAELARECTKGLANASGGGHPKASGATIRLPDLAEFRDNIVSQIKSKVMRS